MILARRAFARGRARRAGALAGVLLWLVLAVALAVGLDIASVHYVAANSDGATVVLEGQSIRSGDSLLSGWALSLDSFWSLDALFYAVFVAVSGVRHELVNLVPAVIADLVVLVGMVIARSGRRGPAGLVGPIMVLAVLGLPSPALAFFFLQGPWHVGTTLVCLLAFAGLSRGSFDAGYALGVVALALGLLGDVQTLALGVVPVLFAGLVAMARCRSARAGAATVSAPFAAIALAGAVRLIAQQLGTYAIVSANPTARLSQVGFNLSHLAERWAGLFGAGTVPIGRSIEGSHLGALHVVVLVVVLASILVVLARTVHGIVRSTGAAEHDARRWRFDDLLLLGVLGDLGAFVVLAGTGNGDYARYLTAGVVFASVLAGRSLGELAALPSRGARAVAPLVLVVLAGLATAFSLDLGSPSVSRPALALARVLRSDGLTVGIGDYWSASIVTVESDDGVVVRPVIEAPDGHLARYGRQSSSAWYAGTAFHFLVFDTARPWRGVDAASASATFGRPERTIAIGTYRVLVWKEPLSISSVGFSNP